MLQNCFGQIWANLGDFRPDLANTEPTSGLTGLLQHANKGGVLIANTQVQEQVIYTMKSASKIVKASNDLK